MNPLAIIFLGAGLMLATFTILWLIQRFRGNAGIVDVGWAASLGLLAVMYGVLAEGYPLRRLVVAVMVGVWSVRLTTYLFLNRVHNRPEDGRYVLLRKNWGDNFQSRLFFFYHFQGLANVFLSLPILAVMLRPEGHLTAWDFAGVALWAAAICGEALADAQLARWRDNPANRGRTCRQGLWRYSRHPNYFFEWMFWWSFVVMAVGSPLWWLTLLGPVLMIIVLYKVTGIPYTEKQALLSRGEDYRKYQRTTSAFVPWFPREEKP